MKKVTKISTIIGCISFALIGGLMMTACESKSKEIDGDVFSTYINQSTTILNFDKGIHGVIQEDADDKIEFWILKNSDNTYSLKQTVSSLDETTYTYVKNGFLYREENGKKVYTEVKDYTGEEYIYSMSGFNAEVMKDSIENLMASATKFTETISKDSIIYDIEGIDGEKEADAKISFKNDKIVKYQYSIMTENGKFTNFMEEFKGEIDFEINFDEYYQCVGNFDELKEAVKKDNKILITSDIELEEPLIIDKNITIDVDEHFITMSLEMMFVAPSIVDENVTKTWSMFAIEGGNLIIDGNGWISSNNALAVFSVGYNGFGENKIGRTSGSLTIKSGNIKNESFITDEENDFEDCIIYVENGTVTIEGGQFRTDFGSYESSEEEIYQAKKNMFKINEQSVDSKIVIKGGEFEYYKPQESGFLDEDYQANNDDDESIWVVTKKEVA